VTRSRPHRTLPLALALTASATLLLAGCTHDGAPHTVAPTHAAASATAAPATAKATSVGSLPNIPPASAGCQGNVIDHRDVSHPDLGTVRVFLVVEAAAGEGCVASVTGSGSPLPPIPIDTFPESLAFASTATDASSNT